MEPNQRTQPRASGTGTLSLPLAITPKEKTESLQHVTPSSGGRSRRMEPKICPAGLVPIDQGSYRESRRMELNQRTQPRTSGTGTSSLPLAITPKEKTESLQHVTPSSGGSWTCPAGLVPIDQGSYRESRRMELN